MVGGSVSIVQRTGVSQWQSPAPSVPQAGPPPLCLHQTGGCVCFRRRERLPPPPRPPPSFNPSPRFDPSFKRNQSRSLSWLTARAGVKRSAGALHVALQQNEPIDDGGRLALSVPDGDPPSSTPPGPHQLVPPPPRLSRGLPLSYKQRPSPSFSSNCQCCSGFKRVAGELVG